jgi:hypothetical protein
MSLDNSYLKEIQKELGYFAAGVVDRTYAVGDYGDMDGKQFERLGNISKWIDPKSSTENGSETIYYTSAGEVDVVTKIGAKDVTGKAQVDISISFSKENSIFFLAQNVKTIVTANLAPVGNKIVDVYHQPGNAWKLSYVWIAEVKQAGFFKLIVSQSSQANVRLSGKVPLLASGVPVANIDFSVLTTTEKNAVIEVGGPDQTPLFRLYEVKDPITAKAYYTEYK